MSGPTPMEAAVARGHEGAELAAARAGEDWKDAAYFALCGYAATNGEFTIEDVRESVRDLPPPPDGRAWGQVATRARRAGVIVPAGYRPTKASNGSPKVLWRRAGA